VNISLRPFSKFWYSVPEIIRGMFFDMKGFGATYFDVGMGLSFFNNNVRFQGQFGISPEEGLASTFVHGGRYVGYVAGVKLLANIATIPFDWLFKDRDWAHYKVNFALGANFSKFWMDEPSRKSLWMGAIVAQVDLANIDFKIIYPNWKRFHVWALYLQPEVWFASTDVIDVEKTIFRICIGLRINVF